MDRDLSQRFRNAAIRLGFDRVGIAPAIAPASYPLFVEWLDAGYSAGMTYLQKNATVREHPEKLLDGVRSVVMLSMVYGSRMREEATASQGKVARYARGADYHEVIWGRLEALLAWLIAERPEARGRALCDTAPLLERDFARLAGLGWVGKNTMLIDRRIGSFTFLSALLVDVDLEPDPPHESNHCGTCTRCLDACPTQAFPQPYTLDARKCISYWTIEHKGPIDESFADQLDGWVFGCDICQDVCPWNRKAPMGQVAELEPRPELVNPDLIAWLMKDAGEFKSSIKSTALARAKRSGLLRNAALILGQRGIEEAVPALIARLGDDDSVVRDAAAWALRRIGTDEAIEALAMRPDEAR